METGIHEQKMAKAYRILSKGDRPEQIDDETFTVPSQAGNWFYTVRKLEDDNWVCDCPDHHKRNAFCKHIYTVQFWLGLRENIEDKAKDHKPMNFHPCPKCGNYEVIRRGYRKTKKGRKQRFECRECGHYFSLKEEGFEDMKFSPEIVSECLDLYFKGLSYRKVADHINKSHDGLEISHVMVYYWVKRYTKIISEYVDTLEPELGSVWSTDEMLVKVKHDGIHIRRYDETDWVWLWNTIDTKTRFLIANMVSKKRGLRDARNIFKKAKDHAGCKPNYMITDGLRVYHRAFNRVFYDHHQTTEHISEVGIADKVNNNKIERLHGTFRERDKVMRALFNPKTSDDIFQGQRVYYNFIRPHMALDGQTPAEKAGLDLNLGNDKWLDLIKLSISAEHLTEVSNVPQI